MDPMDKRMIPALSGMEQDGTKFHHAENRIQFTTFKLFISRISHSVFLELWLTMSN